MGFSACTQIIAPSTLSWHIALPRLMLREEIDLGPCPDLSADRRDSSSYLAYGYILAVMNKECAFGSMQRIWEPPV